MSAGDFRAAYADDRVGRPWGFASSASLGSPGLEFGNTSEYPPEGASR